MIWHSLDIDEVYAATESSSEGLGTEIAKKKLETFGPNELEAKKKKSAWMIFLSQFSDFMILVLVVAAVISGIAGDRADAIIILVIIVINAIVGFLQEYKAEKAMEALKRMAVPQTVVRRDGTRMTIPSQLLVPGDIVLLEAGNTVPADLRLVVAHSLKAEESSLTGESVPVDKTITTLKDRELVLGDRFNMVYKSTQITNGRGEGIVVGTGMQTEMGKIATMLQEEESNTPLQKRMTDFGKKLSYLILLICAVLFGVGLLRGEEPVQMLLVSISLAVAAIPEALPALITVALSRGASRLVKKNALIRKLPAVETLGSVSFICTDKTGTLTQNKMTVVDVRQATESGEDMLLLCMGLNHDVHRKKDAWSGDPTEIAIVQYLSERSAEALVQKLKDDHPRKAEIPFDSDRKCMTTIHHHGDQFLVVSKGAVEAISGALTNEHDHEAIGAEAGRMASEGIRVIAYGYKFMDQLPSLQDIRLVESDLIYAGLVGMVDPPREDIFSAIAECRSAGIRPVMITGDHKETAAAIARKIGLLSPEHKVITGVELGRMDAETFSKDVEDIGVYARVSPEQKLQIVKALQEKGHFVAMTGDGVNDAPSLKRANIGIAMGITGTDVSKEAAHMILLDDRFTTIVSAVKEGRRIYDNIRKFVKYIMTCNSAEIWTIFLAPLLGLPIPLLPIHILWINLVTDGLPGLALSLEKADRNIMTRRPRSSGESLFAEGIGLHIVWVGMFMAAVTLATQAFAIRAGDPHWQTMVFTVLSLSQLGHVLAIRSDHEFIYSKGFFSNPALLGSILITTLLQLAVIYLPVANTFFKTAPLTLEELLICFGAAVLVFHAVEAEKWVKKLRRSKADHHHRRS